MTDPIPLNTDELGVIDKVPFLLRVQAIEWPGTSSVRKELRKARIYSGISQFDMGKEVGVSRNTIGYWERGLKKPQDHHMKAWREALFGA